MFHLNFFKPNLGFNLTSVKLDSSVKKKKNGKTSMSPRFIDEVLRKVQF